MFQSLLKGAIQKLIDDECAINFNGVPERVYLLETGDLNTVYSHFQNILTSYKDQDKFLWSILVLSQIMFL